MRKNLFLLVALLAFVAVGTPSALADNIVDITLPTATIPGNLSCSCFETFSASLEYDNTTKTVLLFTTEAGGADCCFSTLFSYGGGSSFGTTRHFPL